MGVEFCRNVPLLVSDTSFIRRGHLTGAQDTQTDTQTTTTARNQHKQQLEHGKAAPQSDATLLA